MVIDKSSKEVVKIRFDLDELSEVVKFCNLHKFVIVSCVIDKDARSGVYITIATIIAEKPLKKNKSTKLVH